VHPPAAQASNKETARSNAVQCRLSGIFIFRLPMPCVSKSAEETRGTLAAYKLARLARDFS